MARKGGVYTLVLDCLSHMVKESGTIMKNKRIWFISISIPTLGEKNQFGIDIYNLNCFSCINEVTFKI
jgi:hypothetical protein